MKTSLCSFFIVLFATAFLSSCEKCGNVIITEPTAADAAWLVYKKNDTISFVTETAQTVRYTRSGIIAQGVPGEGFSATDECIEKVHTQLRTVMEDLGKKQPSLLTRILTKPDTLVVELGVGGTNFWEVNLQEAPKAANVNGVDYKDVYEVLTKNTKESEVKRILYNQEFGILSVEFNGGKKLERRPKK